MTSSPGATPVVMGRETPAGYELDAIVCEAFGIVGREMWYARAPGSTDSSWIDGTSREDVERIVREVEARGIVNDWRRGSTVERVVHYPRVSTDMGEAWRVVETLRARGIYIDVETTAERYRACAGREGGDNEDIWVLSDWCSADTAPLAICRAALLAVGAA